MLKVGNRLQHFDLSFDHKHPVLLTKIHLLIDHIIEQYHGRNQHPGIRNLQWYFTCVEALHLGRDGIARVATVLTANGVFKRPIVKLSPLPEQC
ncbi:hypothetical protein PR048_000897 [Dryococelus australis]|uniref:DUF5641 domain-containing protein n=1 Tax=Dryococelus australis TaxID=614101 RepID=A0ABQ9IG00_9NEOP|nr:hypothetical protein PR048_000897 [Dryococelus australis]